jgi:hypothetical protein
MIVRYSFHVRRNSGEAETELDFHTARNASKIRKDFDAAGVILRVTCREWNEMAVTVPEVASGSKASLRTSQRSQHGAAQQPCYHRLAE